MFQVYFNPTQDGIFFEAAHGWGEGGGEGGRPKKLLLLKICHIYPNPYLKKIKKIYESRDTLLEFC